jgi:uncharacterized protein (DUF362 family)
MISDHLIREQPVFTCSFSSWKQSVPRLLDAAGLIDKLPLSKPVLIKPNLVEAMAPPITTPVELIATLIDYIQSRSPETMIIIGEGCGSLSYDTQHCFAELGYTMMARERGVELIDLNHAPLTCRARKECRRWPEMHLPQIAYESFLISVPVLKAHTLAAVTLTMKNMMGLAPPCYYQQGGHWQKAAFHDRIQEAILDLNRYRTPDFTLLDATIGMQESHLWGPTCFPPLNRLAAGFDPVALDAFGTGLLGKDWRDVGHIRLAHGLLGYAEPLQILAVDGHGG